MPEMVFEPARDSAFAMATKSGALDAETRNLIYLGVALATGSHACVRAMMNKAHAGEIDRAEILETFKIARFAGATRVFGNAEQLFEQLSADW
jgi:AhpD family alkylhydroperoxidase